MVNKLFIKKAYQEYSLSKSVSDREDVTQYKLVLDKGNFVELLWALGNVSGEFYKEKVKINYAKSCSPKVSEEGKGLINTLVREFKRVYSKNFFI